MVHKANHMKGDLESSFTSVIQTHSAGVPIR